MADHIVADESANPIPQSAYSEKPVLVLLQDDYTHLYALINAARDALPWSTGTDGSRAGLRAVLDFLNGQADEDVAGAPSTNASPRSATQSADALTPQELGAIAMTIAGLASDARSMLGESIMANGEDSGRFASVADHLVKQIGYLADLVSRKTGAVAVEGGGEDWFLPPLYHEARETNHA